MYIIYHHRTLGDGAEGIHIEEMVNAFRSLGHEVKVVSPIGEKTNHPASPANTISAIKRCIPKVFFDLFEVFYNFIGIFGRRNPMANNYCGFIF